MLLTVSDLGLWVEGWTRAVLVGLSLVSPGWEEVFLFPGVTKTPAEALLIKLLLAVPTLLGHIFLKISHNLFFVH